MSTPQKKDEAYSRFKTQQPVVPITPAKRTLGMDDLANVKPLRKAGRISEDVDPLLKAFVDQEKELNIRRSDDSVTLARVVKAYKMGGKQFMILGYMNAEGEPRTKEMEVGMLYELNREDLKDYKQFIPRSQDPTAIEQDDDDFYDEPSTVPPPKKRNDSEGKPINVRVNKPNYEFIEDYSGKKGEYADYLIVFADNDKSLCYKKRITAKLEKERGQEFIRLLRTCHSCTPLSYASVMEKANRILNKPEYEIVASKDGKKELFIYTNVNEDECVCEGYKFYYDIIEDLYKCCSNGYGSRAKEVPKGDDFHLRPPAKHINTCQPRQIKDLIVKSQNYVKKNNIHIFVFAKEGSNMGYEYFFDVDQQKYSCGKCRNLGNRIDAKLVEAEDGDYLTLSKRKHVCTTIQYVPDIDQQFFTPIPCPKGDEGLAERQAYHTRLQVHNESDDHVRAVCYVVTVYGPEAPIEDRYSGVAYTGYSENKELRLPQHFYVDSIVGKLIKKYGVVYLVPILHASSDRCYDTEAAGIELRKQGSLDFHFMNNKQGEWKSKGLKAICEDRHHPEHASIALALRRLIYEGLMKTENFISSRFEGNDISE
uniref:Uncharacterized protein n=1 Tax=Panagrolaimus sp. ES5 TaxID=591445 RepID=A0AC34GW53_9BILA